MNLKFWQKDKSKLPKPQELPSGVGRYLVVNLKLESDWVWNLKAVVRPKENVKSINNIRIYDPSTAAAMEVKVKDYTSLDNYPDLILFDGWYDKDSWEMKIRDNKNTPVLETAA
ncbi:Uncharacterized protein dnl_22770 [Desulfonema limicola]|uniref:Uncharacterized protein n=1 Tax=Desulfonema limicola TaxID=45656 RepID=A0A975GG71_9BACT|nr:hypothetical protein [Desulfonema limicola]QTA79992.1 Uncharacterized protein dnl_22770 [Desulfonema limicola]